MSTPEYIIQNITFSMPGTDLIKIDEEFKKLKDDVEKWKDEAFYWYEKYDEETKEDISKVERKLWLEKWEDATRGSGW